LRTTFPGDGTLEIALVDPADGAYLQDPALIGSHALGPAK
jgi:hypothetical protein